MQTYSEFAKTIYEGADGGETILYHLTDDPKFTLDADYSPEDNSVSVMDRSGHKGIYLTRDVEPWVNGHNYWRPFVVEIIADKSVVELDGIGRWAGEIFVSSSHFDLISVKRVVPLDAYAREKFGMHGWIESSIGKEFDTGNDITSKYWERPFANYRYEGDTRTMKQSEIDKIKQHFEAGLKARLN